MADVDIVRALYGDLEPDDEGNYVLPDSAIEAYLTVAKDNYYRAAAAACRAIASSEILLKGYLRADDLAIDGVKGAESLRLLAQNLESRAREEELSEDQSAFEIVFPKNEPSCVPEATPAPVYWGSSRCR